MSGVARVGQFGSSNPLILYTRGWSAALRPLNLVSKENQFSIASFFYFLHGVEWNLVELRWDSLTV
jgi:hypothetical protein